MASAATWSLIVVTNVHDHGGRSSAHSVPAIALTSQDRLTIKNYSCRVYVMDRLHAARGDPVAERDLLYGGACQDAGVEAPMYLRLRATGRREAVHERREDEERHVVPVSDEHKAYQERILRAATEGGFRGDSEVRTRVGRSWIQTDTLVEGAAGLRIGWEVQLSSASVEGPRSVRARASKAERNGITPAWRSSASRALSSLLAKWL
ncbi:hypothetical protein [Streptomyces sp. NPDC001601]|uniref:hypothetical protein n=1 Tax=Streptomyces sp. NPDC001601 TaxID=3364592 RepID=UPI0036798094